MNQEKYLFSYASLQLEKVQLEICGRIFSGEKDSLRSFKLDKVQIADVEVLKNNRQQLGAIAVRTDSPNDLLEGTIYELTEEELLQIDRYQGGDYKREMEVLTSGKTAWIYVAKIEKPISSIEQNIDVIRKRIQKACEQSQRKPNEVQLLLATKTVDAERIKAALQYGETLIAENKVQEIKQKYEALLSEPHQQHFIGHLQTNKIKEILKYNVGCIQSLDRWTLAEKLHEQLLSQNKTIDVFIQVNTSAEESKFGISPQEALAFTKQVATLSTIRIKGLMTIGLFSSDAVKVRACFKRLKAVQQEIIDANMPDVQMDELSMGMSGDLEIAIEEGATIVRVGTAVFGQRQYPDSYYWNEQSKD